MKNVKDSKAVYWQLMQLMFQSKHRIYQIAEKYDLTMMQSSALTILSDDDPKAMRALSDYFMCDASTVTGLVDRLEARKLIARTNHPSDRRVKLLSLTDKGAATKAVILNETLAVEEERLKTVLSVEERQTLRELLAKILADSPE